MLSESGDEVNPFDGVAKEYERNALHQAGRGLERNRLRHIVEAEILVLNAIMVDLNDPKS